MWKVDYTTERQVSRHRGTLPVLISCPHGGSEQPEGVNERDGSATPAGCNFQKKSDLNTREVALGIAQRLVDLFGEAPYVVIADCHRKYIDANRSPACAYESAAARPFYDAYHATLRGFVDEIRAENAGAGLLFDIHGTAGIAGDPATIFLGTDNSRSVARLLASDPQALFRRRSLRGFLEAAGHVVAPRAPGEPEPASRFEPTAARTPTASTRCSSKSRTRCAPIRSCAPHWSRNSASRSAASPRCMPRSAPGAPPAARRCCSVPRGAPAC